MLVLIMFFLKKKSERDLFTISGNVFNEKIKEDIVLYLSRYLFS